MLTMIELGFGRHSYYAAQENGQFGLKTLLILGFVSQIIYICAVGLVKVSVGFMLLRIFKGLFPVYRTFIFTLMALTGFYTIIATGKKEPPKNLGNC